MKEYPIFPKTLALEPHHLMQFIVISWTLIGRQPYPSTEMQLAYLTAEGDWAASYLKQTERI